MTGRNDKCPCSSGIKYKNCYGRELDACSLYQAQKKRQMLQGHNDKEKLVMRFFNEANQDIGSVFAVNDENEELVASRVQLISVFTYIDVIASYWFEYQERTGTPRERFVEWMSEHGFTDRNEYYPDSVFCDFDASRLYDFRSSLVHFLGLGQNSGDTFAISPNDEVAQELMDKFIQKLRNRGDKVHALASRDLFNLVSEGAILMLTGWIDIINQSQTDADAQTRHVSGIDRIYNKINQEGAVKVPYKQ